MKFYSDLIIYLIVLLLFKLGSCESITNVIKIFTSYKCFGFNAFENMM